MSKSFLFALAASVAALALGASAPAAQGDEPAQPRGAREPGASLVLPDFNPAQSFDQLESGMQRLQPVAEALRTANEQIQPLVEEFQVNPTLENQGQLERSLAGLTADLARKIRTALAQREKVTFAFQDLLRGTRAIRASVATFAEHLKERAAAEEKTLAETMERLRAVAEAWDAAEGEEKAAHLEEFKRLHHERQRLAYRARFLGALARHYAELGEGVERLAATLQSLHARVEDVFDRVEDAGEMLAFAAGYRRDATGLVQHYRAFFGEGEASVRTVLERIQTVQGQLDIFEKTTSVIDEAGTLTPMLQDLETLTRDLVEAQPGQEDVLDPRADRWTEEIRRVLEGGANAEAPPPQTPGGSLGTAPAQQQALPQPRPQTQPQPPAASPPAPAHP